MKTFKQMFDEVMSLAQRKAVGRRMKIMGKKREKTFFISGSNTSFAYSYLLK